MPARINHNAHLRQVHRNLSLHHANASRQVEKLASGMRVNRASDDPASVALADGINSEIRAVSEGTRNIQQTFSLLQVADGTLNEISSIIVRMESLAMEAASSVFNDRDRMNINSEFEQLREEIDRIAGATTYNGRHLLTGAGMTLGTSSTTVTGAAASGISDIRVSDAAAGTYTFVDELDEPGENTITLGNGALTQTIHIGDELVEGSVPAGSHVVVDFDLLGIRVTLNGPDVAGVPGVYGDGELDGQTILVEELEDLTFQLGPSETSNDVARIRIPDMRASGPELAMMDISIVTIGDARRALTRLGDVQRKVIEERNRIGAFQNRLELSIDTSMSVLERMRGTESEIREADVSRSVTELSQSQVLAEAATSIALEADTDIERILSLLR